jgi:hypothetical protein
MSVSQDQGGFAAQPPLFPDPSSDTLSQNNGSELFWSELMNSSTPNPTTCPLPSGIAFGLFLY